jgi:murein L,D-transpeptidase YcbB/YkuD
MYMQFDENVMYLNSDLSEKAHKAGYAVAGYSAAESAESANPAPALPSGRVYPLIKSGATDAKVESNTGIKGLITWLNGALYEELFAAGKLDSYQLVADPSTFGAESVENVKAFQALKGLKVDGSVGKNTWKALGYTGVNNSQGKVYTPSSKPASAKKEEEGKVNPYEQWYEKTWVQVAGGVIFVGAIAGFFIFRKRG